MNERIEELAKKCRGYHPPAQIHFDHEKFAKLIVQECIDQCADIPNSGEEYDKGIRWAANQIKQHFGIES